MNASNGHTVVGSLSNLTNGYQASNAAKPPVTKESPYPKVQVGMELPNIYTGIYDFVKSKSEPICATHIAEALEKLGYRKQSVQTAISIMKKQGLIDSYGPAKGTTYPDLLHLADKVERPEGNPYVRKPTKDDIQRKVYATQLAEKALKTVDLKKINQAPSLIPPTTNNSIRSEIGRISAAIDAQTKVAEEPAAKVEVAIDPEVLDHNQFKLSWRGNLISLKDGIEMHKELSVLVEVLTKMNLLQKG